MTLNQKSQQIEKNKVLIVEDEFAVANFCAMALNEAGINARIVQDLSQVERDLQTFSPHLILLDLYIPDFDTMEFIRHLRRQENYVTIPIILISAHDNPDNRLCAYDAGADDFIEKPVHPDYLISIVNSRIKRLRHIKSVIELQQIERGTLPTQKLGAPEKLKHHTGSRPQSTSIADDILCKLLLDFDIVSAEEMQDLLRRQSEMENDEYFVRLYDLILYLKVVDEHTLCNISLLKDIGGTSLIEGYQADEMIAEGGMGVVYSGYETSTQKRVAIKVFYDRDNTHLIDLQRFIRECDLAQSLDHEGITKAYKFGEINNIYYIVMEFIDGVALSEKIKEQGYLVESEALQIFGKALQAMSFAWEKDIIHRDLKPDNIMLTVDGDVKICDLGLAKAINSNAQLTQDNVILGTPSYMSPEQCMGATLDYRSDLYSLGVTLYVMLTGKEPFHGNFLEVAQGHMTEVPPQPKVKLSEPIHKFMYQLLYKKPAWRCVSIKGLLRDFDDVQRGRLPYTYRLRATKKTLRKQLYVLATLVVLVFVVLGSFWSYEKFYHLRQRNVILAHFSNKQFAKTIYLSYGYLLNNPNNIQIQKIRAQSWLKLRKYQQAVKYFAEVVVQSPNEDEILGDYAYALYYLKRFDEAQRQIEKVLLTQKSADHYYLLARINWQKQRSGLSKKYLKKAIALTPEYWQAYYLLGIVDDVKWFNTLYEYLPQDCPVELRQWIYYVNGVLLYRQHQYDKSKKQFLFAQAFGETKEINQYLAAIFCHKNNHDKTVQLLGTERLSFAKTLENIHTMIDIPALYFALREDLLAHYLATAFLHTNSPQKALFYIKKALKQNPKEVKYLKTSSDIYHKLKKYQKSIAQLHLILKYAPDQKYQVKLHKAKNLIALHKWQESLILLNELVKVKYNLRQVMPLQIEALIYRKNTKLLCCR
ncbi:serine/threonine protein kinase [Candidatus Uabimicrobium amorphum]|uniref:Serine/threonine protein kinase n=1 Tax=Uabimicrobium amorphum TaxID=2596890 RepID=A0A5S9ITM3_UABAM|nr:protein kinase [Candidatus Uabimicrobium amorphum]BBM87928.1 serine/threonine protein kinase [Candidatus Uabimicrobium amorphum]